MKPGMILVSQVWPSQSEKPKARPRKEFTIVQNDVSAKPFY